MATFAEELVDDLVTAGVITAKGTDGFYAELPDTDISPSVVVAVGETGGIPATGPPWPWMSVQFLVRSAVSWQTARETAADIYNRYHEADDLALTSYRILTSKAETLPMFVGPDTRGRYLVSVGINFRVVALSQISGGTGYGGSKDPTDFPA